MKSILSNPFRSITISLLILTAFSACSTRPPERTKLNLKQLTDNKSHIQAAWVVLSEQGQPIARVITTGMVCPTLLQDGVQTNMNVRAQPAIVAERFTASSADQSKPAEFPVLTCGVPLKKGVTSVSVEGIKLPLPKPVPLKIVVIGGTGCRMKASDNAFQACDDTNQWAFSTVAKTAAGFKPDLVVHVGGYHYRENACPDNKAGCAGSPWGYGWDTWQADFFAPAAPLLEAAPWVMVRGNHESCFRAGQGWWRFMDPRLLKHGRECNVEANDAYGDYSAPYAVPLGAGSQLIVFDSSKAPSKPLDKNDPAYQTYFNQFMAANQLAQQADFSFLLKHHPILGFEMERSKSNHGEVKPGNAGLQSVLQDIHPQRLFDPNVEILLAGHAHLFEAITFKSDHPTQFVVGNGGALPDMNLPEALPQKMTPFVKAQIAHFKSTNQPGFMTMERTSETATDWIIKSWDKHGGLMTTCHVNKSKKACV